MLRRFFEFIEKLEDKSRFEELIAVLEKKGIIEKEIKEIFENVINTSDTIVREIMVPRTDMIAVSYDIKFSELIDIFDKFKFSRLPVFRDNIDNIIGFVYSKDVLAFKLNGNSFNIAKILRKPLFIPETKKILSLLKEFKEKKVHIAVVVDEFGGISGLVTLIDIVEEIIGDFEDEFEVEEQKKIEKIAENEYLINSKCALEDIEDITGTKIPEGPYDTIGGYVIKEFGRLPAKNERLKKEKFEIIVNQIYEKGIKNIILKVL